MITISGKIYIEHGDVVEMDLYRGGGYIRDSSVYEGGRWIKKLGVAIVKRAPLELQFLPHLNTAGNPDGNVTRTDASGRVSPEMAWVKFFDGDTQATDTSADRVGWPDGAKRFLRKATPEELGVAEGVYGFAVHTLPIVPSP